MFLGNGPTGPGPDSIPWGIWFPNSDAVLLVDVRPTVPEKSTFTQNWEDTKKALEQSAEEVLGNNLEAIDFYTKQGNGESTIYVVEFAGSQVDGSWYVTVCYCFGDNYMAEFIGVNPLFPPQTAGKSPWEPRDPSASWGRQGRGKA